METRWRCKKCELLNDNTRDQCQSCFSNKNDEADNGWKCQTWYKTIYVLFANNKLIQYWYTAHLSIKTVPINGMYLFYIRHSI